MNVQDYLGPPTEATLPGSDEPIDLKTLREAQILLCQHAPEVTGGIETLPSIELRWFEVTAELSFREQEYLAIGNPFPRYREMIAHLNVLNKRLREGAEVPDIFSEDCDIVTSVCLFSEILWLDMAVTDRFISFTCLGPTTRKLYPDRKLLFAA